MNEREKTLPQGHIPNQEVEVNLRVPPLIDQVLHLHLHQDPGQDRFQKKEEENKLD